MVNSPPTLIDIVAETAIVSFSRTARWLPHCQQHSKNSLYTLFCSLILDHGVLLIISISGAKIHISYFLLNTSFHHSFQSVIWERNRRAQPNAHSFSQLVQVLRVREGAQPSSQSLES